MAASPLRVESAIVDEAARFAAIPFVPAGFAYDAVSRRFLFGDADGRRLFVVGEGSNRPVDLARAENAGFDRLSAFAIDAARGVLWVTSSDPQASRGKLHQLQLISGREVGSIPLSGEGTGLRVIDMAVGTSGSVFLLDDVSARLLTRQPSANSTEVVMPLPVTTPSSIAVADDGRTAYVAHADGLLRVDLRAKTSADVEAPAGTTLAGLRWIRWHRGSLIARQQQPDGSQAMLRLGLARGGQRVSGAVIIETSDAVAASAPSIVGDDLYYPVVAPNDAAPGATITVHRVRLTPR